MQEVFSLIGYDPSGVYTQDDIDLVLSWSETTCPSTEIWKRLGAPGVRTAFVRAKRAATLAPWAAKWKMERFVKDASWYELKVTMTRNPYYPVIAYGGSMRASEDLGVPSTKEMKAHAVVFELVRNGPVEKSSVDKVLSIEGLGGIDVTQVKPFDVFDHPLRSVDLDHTSPADLNRLAGPHWGVQAAKEMRNMTNDLILENGMYTRKRNVEFLSNAIYEMLKD